MRIGRIKRSLCCILLAGCASEDPGVATLDQTLGSVRWLEARISLDRPTRACVADVAEALPGSCTVTVSSAVGDEQFRQLALLERSFGAHERALFHLARGAAPQVAATLLEEQIAQTRTSAAAWSDLSAAYLNAAHRDDWRSLDSAAVAIDTAAAIDPGYERAHFNRALLLERLQLDALAIEAWGDFIEQASDDIWIAEAQARIASLEQLQPSDTAMPLELTVDDSDWQALVHDRPSDVRKAFFDEGVLLGKLARNAASFCAGEALAWKKIGLEFHRLYGDSLLSDTMHWACNAVPLDTAAIDGVERLGAAVQWYRLSETERALKAVISASRKLADSGSPLVVLARAVHASTLFSRQDYARSRQLLTEFLEAYSGDYPLLSARVYATLGSIEIRNKDHEKATEYFARGVALLARGGDPEQLVRLRSLFAEALARAGRYDEAWQTGVQALADARQKRLSPSTFSATCEFIAIVAAESGAAALQRSFSDCSIIYLSQDEDPSIVASAHLSRAHARHGLDDVTGTVKDLDRARAAALSIQDEVERLHILTHVNLFTGVEHVPHSPRRAVALLDDAREYFGRSGNVEYEMLAGQALIDAYFELGELDRADAELDRLAGIAARAQRNSRAAGFVLSTDQHNRPVANRRIKLKLARDERLGALRAHLESRLARSLSTGDLTDLVARVGSVEKRGATLIYSWLEDEVVGWLVGADGLSATFRTPLPQGRKLVARAANTHTTPLEGGRIGALSQLYDALIRPVGRLLENNDRLRIVPDGLLFGVPFPSLVDSETGRYLIEDFELVISPQLKFSARRTGGNIETIAVFAADESDPLQPLPSVRAEALQIEKLFANAAAVRIYSGANATNSAFVAALSRYDLVHFGGHGEVSLHTPLASRLILHERASADGFVTAAELYELEAGRMPQLVVLAACDTAAYTNRLPQALALVRPFLELGASQVLGSLRPIPDERYLEIMQLFYRALRDTGEPEAALRQVQLRLARTPIAADLQSWDFLQLYEYF